MKPQRRQIWLGAMMAAVACAGGVAGQKTTGPVIDGRLIDNETSAAISQGSIQLLDSDGVMVASVLSNDAGRFRIGAAKAGNYRLRAERLGYQTAVSPQLALAQNDSIGVDFHLSAKAVLLTPVIVRASARPHATQYETIGMGDFFRRMTRWERANSGAFMTRNDVAKFENGSTSRMLSRVSGVNIIGTGNIGMRSDCGPRYYLNGAPYTIMGGTLDTLFPPETLEAVEVYVGSAVPGEFFGGNCGVVVLWTRRT